MAQRYGMDDFGGNAIGGNNYGAEPVSPAASRGGGVARPRKAYEEQTLLPVTIRMILRTTAASNDAGTGSLALADGRLLHHVKFVGAVRSAEDASTHVVFQIEDGTGLIEVRQWSDHNDCVGVAEMRQEASAQPHGYVRVIGQVKEYDGHKTVVGYSVKKVTTGNELTHHMLEVLHSAEKYKANNCRGAIIPRDSGVGFGAPHSSLAGTPVRQQQGGAAANAELHSSLLGFIKTHGAQSAYGANITDFIRQLSGSHTEQQVRAIIESLIYEGLVYSTINDNTYKLTGE